ncbi:hypothetical protein [Nucisporomicrobium flavum]|uniref:hypothetical protein n=1 Tax=Nucisporomicrobium flavum TaxID=2785915 RepID=UPI0018F28600|nr:hypothetical protein [Nucisporomicrobium flavum]
MLATWWLRLCFLAASGLQVAALFLDRRLVPYSGTVAMAALFALAASGPDPSDRLDPDPRGPRRWTHRAALTGLALLTLTAFLVDHRTGGYGWPAEFAAGYGYHWADMTEPALLTAAGAALAAAVLGRTGSPWRWRNVPAALLAALYVFAVAEFMVRPRIISGWMRPPALVPQVPILLTAAVVVAALVMAANAALVSGRVRRQASAGVLAVVSMAMAGLGYISDNNVIAPTVDSAVWQKYQPDVPAYGVSDARWSPPPDLAVLAAWAPAPPAPPEVRDIEAVAGPPSWTPAVFDPETDWERAWPAVHATLLLAGLAALMMALFSRDEPAG